MTLMATAAERLQKIIQELSESKLIEVLDFAESLQRKTSAGPVRPGTLTGLPGVAKSLSQASDGELHSDYVDYLMRKYQ